MEYRMLGHTELSVSAVSLGCMSFHPKQEAEAIDCIRFAIDQGVNLVDTADLYDHGLNEAMVGKAIAPYRDKVILATKVGNSWRPDGSGWDWLPRKSHILSAVEASLRRLATDRIDLYQLHGGTIKDPIDEVIDAFETLRVAGKIRHYGISSLRPNVIRAYVGRAPIASVMIPYNMADRRPEEAVFPLLEEHQIGVLARGVLVKGLLTGKPPVAYLGQDAVAMKAAADVVRQLSGTDRTPVQTLIRFALSSPVVTTAVIGVRTLEQLQEVLGTLQAPNLTHVELQLLKDALQLEKYTAHR